MVTHSNNKLFTPVQVGAITLTHRIVMPPMSRLRAQWPSGVPSDLMLEYYGQRTSDGGLIFTEAHRASTTTSRYRAGSSSPTQSMRKAAACLPSCGTLAVRHTSQ
jgi:N-ethylmaleimide reductase